MTFNKTRSFLRLLAGVACIVALATGTALAQTSSASLSGVVRDPSGGVIQEAEITVTHLATDREFRTTTDGVGRYIFLSIPLGQYRIRGTASGFTTVEREFELTVNQAANLNLEMPLGAVTEVVDVTAETPIVNATTSTVGTVIEERSLFDLPLNGRDFSALINLTPGVSPIDVAQGRNSGPSIQGQRNRDNWYMTDGAMNVSLPRSGVGLTPPIDSIQEFQVQSINNDAEFGSSSGGYVNMVTKSGTNQLHGSLYDYLRNNALDARHTFQPRVPIFRQNQFGFSVGGPVHIPKVYTEKSKTFFFVAYEGFRFRQARSGISLVPTQAQRQGNFAGFNTIYDPFSTRPDPQNPDGFARDPFPNNQVPGSRIHPISEFWLREFMPTPNLSLPGVRNNFIDSASGKDDRDTVVWRVDHNVTDNHRLFFRWMQSDQSSGAQLPTPRDLRSVRDFKAKNVVAGWNSTLTPTTLLNLRYSSHRHEQLVRGPLVEDFYDFGNFSDPDQFPANLSDFPLAPRIIALGYGDFLRQNFNTTELPTHSGTVNFQTIWGRHTFKAGYTVTRVDNFNGGINPVERFREAQTRDPADPGGTGDSMASLLLGVPNDAGRAIGEPFADLSGSVHGIYLQDTFRVTPQLSLNVGLRWDYNGNFSTRDSNFGAFDQQAGFSSKLALFDLINVPGDRAGWLLEGPVDIPGAIFQGPNVRRGLVDPDWNNFGPRFGIAYSITPKTVIRTGFSVFYNVFAGKQQISQGSRVTWPKAQFLSTGNINLTTVEVTIDNPFQGLPSDPNRPNPFPAGGYQINRYYSTPYVYQWNLALERQISDTFVVSGTYVGAAGHDLECCGVINQAFLPGPGNPNNRDKPFPRMRLIRTNRNDGYSDYHSLQMKAEQRFAKGLSYLLSYTWSKSTDLACSGYIGVGGCDISQPYTLGADHSISAFNATNVVNLSFIYELPFGHGRKFDIQNPVLNQLAGGWQVSSIMNFRSGMPLTVSLPFDNPNIGGATRARPDLVGDPMLSNPTRLRWFNTDAFAAPERFTFGNAGRNIIRGPMGHNQDISVFKNFTLRERLKLQYRTDFFNAFNLTRLRDPSLNGRRLGRRQYGQITSASPGRVIQMALKLIW